MLIGGIGKLAISRLGIWFEPLYRYLRRAGTSFSSRVFHQIVGFSTKSSQIKNCNATSKFANKNVDD